MKTTSRILSIALMILGVLIFFTQNSYAEIPHLINYQGKLTDSSGSPITGTKAITFKIYEQESGGSPVWSETHSTVSLEKGIFSVMLGGVSALNVSFDKPYWLSIQVGADPEMSPRQRIASSGYAFRAENAENAAQSQNANMVNNVSLSTTPSANKILPLDGNAKLPASALKTYDSGWFAITRVSTYTKMHNLGTTKVIAMVWVAQNSDGSGWCFNMATHAFPGVEYQTSICSLSAATVKIRTSSVLLAAQDENGNAICPPNGYCRVIMLALE